MEFKESFSKMLIALYPRNLSSYSLDLQIHSSQNLRNSIVALEPTLERETMKSIAKGKGKDVKRKTPHQ